MDENNNEIFKSPFKVVGGNEGGKCLYNKRLDTYGKGCQHDCKYCYAKSLLDFRRLWNASRPAVANFQQIHRIINRQLQPGDIVRLGGMTDCFMPKEKHQRITYRTIEELNRRGVGYLIVTKSALVASDEYLAVMDKRLAHIQVSITTTDDTLSRTYEKASLPSERIKAVEKLQEAGFDVAVRLSPYIPQYIDLDVINAIKCDKILVEFLRVNTWIKKWFDVDYSEYTIKQSGYEHLPLQRKIELLAGITGFKEVSVCEDETGAYNYWRENVNHNPEDCCNLRKGGDNE